MEAALSVSRKRGATPQREVRGNSQFQAFAMTALRSAWAFFIAWRASAFAVASFMSVLLFRCVCTMVHCTEYAVSCANRQTRLFNASIKLYLSDNAELPASSDCASRF